MEDRLPACIATIGRTGAGKTSLAKWLSLRKGAWLVSEAAIKRTLVNSYRMEDSLNEDLRDVGYRAAVAAARELLLKGHETVVDAAFHLARRREWLAESCRRAASGCIWLYCVCDDIEETRRRIARRKVLPPGPHTQANSIDVYHLIDSIFEEPSDEVAQHDLSAAVLTIRTTDNKITSLCRLGQWAVSFSKIVDQCVADIDEYLSSEGWAGRASGEWTAQEAR